MGPGFLFDLHVHSEFSKDALGSVLDLAEASQAQGLHGFALTDHDTVAGHKDILEASQKTGQIIIPGVESTTSAGHVLLLGVEEAPPQGIALHEAFAFAKAAGGVAIPSHPLRMFTGIGPTDLRDLAEARMLGAVEGHNGRDRPLLRTNVLALLGELDAPSTGGSDAHRPDEVGTCWTRLPGPIKDAQAAVQALRAGKAESEGGHIKRLRIWRHRAAMAAGRTRQDGELRRSN